METLFRLVNKTDTDQRESSVGTMRFIFHGSLLTFCCWLNNVSCINQHGCDIQRKTLEEVYSFYTLFVVTAFLSNSFFNCSQNQFCWSTCSPTTIHALVSKISGNRSFHLHHFWQLPLSVSGFFVSGYLHQFGQTGFYFNLFLLDDWLPNCLRHCPISTTH